MNYAVAIDALAECGAVSAALEAEHDAIDAMLRTLNKVMLAGAELNVVLRIIDLVVDYCQCFLRAYKDGNLPTHSAAHWELTQRAQRVRASIATASIEATLGAADLLEALHTHIDGFDNPAYQRILQRASTTVDEGLRGATEMLRLQRMAV